MIPTIPVVPLVLGKKTVEKTIGAFKVAKRAAKILKYGVPSVAFLYGTLKVRGLIRKLQKNKKEKQQQKQLAEMYAEFKKQKAR
jgi:hypothetical protein